MDRRHRARAHLEVVRPHRARWHGSGGIRHHHVPRLRRRRAAHRSGGCPAHGLYRWGNDDAAEQLPDAVDDDTSTVFTFTLEPVPDGTQLTVVETGFDRTSDPAANMASHAEGWVSELDKLVALLERDA